MFNHDTLLLIEIIQSVLDAAYLNYLFTAVIMTFDKIFRRLHNRKGLKGTITGRIVNQVWYWCKWPALAFLILDPFFSLVLGLKMGVWYWLFEVLGFYNWYSYRDAGDDDDEWKKILKKAKEKVVEAGGKLTVVPESA